MTEEKKAMRERKDKKININSEQYNLENLFG